MRRRSAASLVAPMRTGTRAEFERVFAQAAKSAALKKRTGHGCRKTTKLTGRVSQSRS
jgi:hypothetical protein